jgi:HNH endonuclease
VHPSNEATIDHIFPRLDPLRGTRGYEVNTVLACLACNEKRNDEFTESLPIERRRPLAQSNRPNKV